MSKQPLTARASRVACIVTFATLLFSGSNVKAQNNDIGRCAQEWAKQAKRAPHRIPAPNWYDKNKWPIVGMQMASRGHFGLDAGECIGVFMNLSALPGADDWISKHFLFSGFMPLAFEIDTHGTRSLNTTVSQVIVGKFGRRFMFEVEPELAVGFKGENEVEFGLEYANLQYWLTNRTILEAGSYLVPFNVWIERIHPAWINEQRDMPWTSAFVPMTVNGGMIKGSFRLGTSTVLYNAFIGFESDVENLWHGTQDIVGGRSGLVIRPLDAEVGVSYARQDFRSDMPEEVWGAYVVKKYVSLPLFPGTFDLKSDVAVSERGTAVWVEPVWNIWKGIMLTTSYQKFFAPTAEEEHMNDHGDHEHPRMAPELAGPDPEDEHSDDHGNGHGMAHGGGHHASLPTETTSSVFVGIGKWAGPRLKLNGGYQLGDGNRGRVWFTLRW